MAETPQYYLKIGTIEQFNNDLNRVQEEMPEENRITPEYDTRTNWAGDLIELVATNYFAYWLSGCLL